MTDHHIPPPPEARRGNRAGQRTTLGKLAVQREDSSQARTAGLSAAGLGAREVALIAASLARPGGRPDDVLTVAEEFLTWLQP